VRTTRFLYHSVCVVSVGNAISNTALRDTSLQGFSTIHVQSAGSGSNSPSTTSLKFKGYDCGTHTDREGTVRWMSVPLLQLDFAHAVIALMPNDTVLMDTSKGLLSSLQKKGIWSVGSTKLPHFETVQLYRLCRQ